MNRGLRNVAGSCAHAWALVAVSVGASTAAEGQRSPASAADSLVLVRTRCYGECPAYRLSLTAAGEVTFASHNPGDVTRARDTVESSTLANLVQRAERIGFFALPDRLMGDKTLCPIFDTDHPTATLTVFIVAGTKAVEDYSGCVTGTDHSIADVVARLRDLERAVDSATGSKRWVRPARFR